MKKKSLTEKIQTIIDDRIQRVIPEKSRVWETLGYFILASGAFVLLALLSYRPAVTSATVSVPESNWIGPMGIWVAQGLIRWLGIAGLVVPAALLTWGALMVLGFARKFRSKYVLALVAMTIIVAAGLQVQTPSDVTGFFPGLPGGIIGFNIGEKLVGAIGRGGALIFLLGAFFSSLVLTKNLHISKTAAITESLGYQIKKSVAARLESDELETLEATADPLVGKDVSNNEKPNAPTKAKPEKPPKVLELNWTWTGGRMDRPEAHLFKRAKSLKASKNVVEPADLTHQLGEFKIEGEVRDVVVGPVVTTYEFEPAPGTKVAKIVGLEDDLARLLKTSNLRILPTLPGKNTIGFEIPHEERAQVRFGDFVELEEFRSRQVQLPIALGVDTLGQARIVDLAEMPHLLVAGSTGSGKSVFVNTLLASLLCRHSPKDLRLVLIDPKMVELSAFSPIAHMATPVISDTKEALPTLLAVISEMESRYKMMGEVGAKNLLAFNEIVKAKRKPADFSGKWQPFPYIVVVIDEFADLILTTGKEAEEAVTRLAQKARAAGIHLVITTQRPSVQVVTGLIKANFPSRVAFRVLASVDSRTILDQNGAERLLGKGDLLYLSAEGMQRFHGPFLEESELSKLIKACTPS